MRDILAPDSERWRRFVDVFAGVVEPAGYELIVPPMMEDIGVFQRVGESTDLVSKEMYQFTDLGGRHVALRPEQTASVCRAFVQHRPTHAVEDVVRRARTSATRSPSAGATGSSTRSASRSSGSTTRTSTSR